jgi:hypothetical protein
MASTFLNRAVPIFTEDGLAVLRDKVVALAGLAVWAAVPSGLGPLRVTLFGWRKTAFSTRRT